MNSPCMAGIGFGLSHKISPMPHPDDTTVIKRRMTRNWVDMLHPFEESSNREIMYSGVIRIGRFGRLQHLSLRERRGA